MSYSRWEQNRQAYQGNMGSMDFRDETGGFIDYQMDLPRQTNPTPTNVIASQAMPTMGPMPAPITEQMMPPPTPQPMPVEIIVTKPKTAGFGKIPMVVWLALGGVALYYANQEGWLNKKLV
tara:strand:- start:123 stop:485 length:363 start_codon:yes stop_codon:yes gene_type:complete